MGYRLFKRTLDLCVAMLMLIATLPLWLTTALILLLTQGPPVLFRQRRVGLGGVPFTLWKFRTMRGGVPARLDDRPVARAGEDPRVTPFGRLLRRWAVDELPQLLNVLRGEMSLVGPRPLPEADLAHPGWLEGVSAEERARRLAWQAARQTIPPGLTGLWQITPNPEADFDNWMVCDLSYLERKGPALDLLILLRTPWAVLRGRAADQSKAKAETTEFGP